MGGEVYAVIAAAGAAFGAAVLFYLAGEKRASGVAGLLPLAMSPRRRTAARVGGWALCALVFVLCAVADGWARGSAVALTILVTASVASVFAGALYPRVHLAIGLAASAVMLASLALWIAGGLV